MVVAEGLALATTEAAMYLYHSAQTLWRAWQASGHLQMDTYSAPSQTSTDLPAASVSPEHSSPTRTPTELSAAPASLLQQPTDWSLTEQQVAPVGTHSAVGAAWMQSCLDPQSGSHLRPGHASLRIDTILKCPGPVVAALAQSMNPAEAITLLLPLAVLLMGGLAAAWSRCGMPLPRSRLVLVPLLTLVAGELSMVFHTNTSCLHLLWRHAVHLQLHCKAF